MTLRGNSKTRAFSFLVCFFSDWSRVVFTGVHCNRCSEKAKPGLNQYLHLFRPYCTQETKRFSLDGLVKLLISNPYPLEQDPVFLGRLLDGCCLSPLNHYSDEIFFTQWFLFIYLFILFFFLERSDFPKHTNYKEIRASTLSFLWD